MEHKINTSSGSYQSNNSSYRNKSTYEENSDEDNNENESADEQTSDLSPSEAVASEDLQSCSPKEYASSPSSSPILSRRQVLLLGDSAIKSSPTESQARVQQATAHEVQCLSTSDLNPSPYPLQRKPIHRSSTPQESPRSRVQITSVRKEQLIVTGKRSDISRESPSVVKKISSSKAKLRAHSIGETAPAVSNESVKLMVQENLPAIVLCIFLIVTGFCALVHVTTDRQLAKHDDSPLQLNQILEDFLRAFDELNSSFPTQTRTFWKVLRSGTRSIIVQDYPISPAVFIVAARKDAQKTALCIVRKYAAIVTKAFNGRQTIEFTHHLRSADTPEHIKHVIDDSLNNGFSEGSRVAVIHELDKLHGKSAMMFHGYCDNENAPFTRVVILFTLLMDDVAEETDDSVERKLSQVWGKYLDNDKLFPLLSRIGNRNAFVKQESNEILEALSCL